jgi:hypothetical protein
MVCIKTNNILGISIKTWTDLCMSQMSSSTFFSLKNSALVTLRVELKSGISQREKKLTRSFETYISRVSFCVLKKWLHYRLGQCVWLSVRLHDNSSKAHPILMKFCTQNCLINISIWFEDENDWSRSSWVIAKHVILSCAFLCEQYSIPVFSQNKKKATQLLYTIR